MSKKEQTPLHMASLGGHVNILRYLIEERRMNPFLGHLTPLDLAIQTSNSAIIKYYLEAHGYCLFGVINRLGDKIISKCVSVGYLELLKVTMTKLKWTKKKTGFRQNQLLISAASSGHLNILRFLTVECCWKYTYTVVEEQSPLLMSAVASGHLDIVKFLVQELGYSPYKANAQKQTPLHSASEGGHLVIVNFLINDCRVEKSPLQEGLAPIHSASVTGHLHLVQYLIEECGVDPMCELKGRGSALHFAALYGHLSIVKYLTLERHCDPLAKDSLGITPLHKAIGNGQLNVARFMIKELHCNANVVDLKGRTPIFLAAGCDEALLKQEKRELSFETLITELNCDPTIACNDGNTPLHQAVNCCNIKTVKYLVSIFKNLPQAVLARTLSGFTPLHLACLRGSTEIVKTSSLLVDWKRDASLLNDRMGRYPLHYAAEVGDLSLVKLFVMKMSHDPYCRDSMGYMPLHIAVGNGKLDVVQWFICERCMDPNTPSAFKGSSFNIACEHGQTAIVQFLVSLGPKCNTMYTDQTMRSTGLHQAAYYNFSQILEILLKGNHCDITRIDQRGHTPLHIAVDNNHYTAVQLLVSAFKQHSQNFITLKNFSGATPLHYACKNGNLNIAMHLLNEAACDFTSLKDEVGLNPLHYAIIENKIEVVQFLIKQNPLSALCKTKGSNTILHLASHHGHLEIVKNIILNTPLDSQIKNDFGITPLHSASNFGNKSVVEFLLSLPTCSKLCTSNSGDTPLHYASAIGNLLIVQLLTKDLSPNDYTLHCTNTHGVDPCQNAALTGSIHVVNYFVEELEYASRNPLSLPNILQKVKCKGMIYSKELALHRAAERGCTGTSKYLIEEESYSPNCRDNLCRTPLHYAAIGGQKRTIMYLIRAGANVSAADAFHNLPIAVSLGHREAVEELSKANSPCTTNGVFGLKPLDMATIGGHTYIFNYLKSKVASAVHSKDFYFIMTYVV